MVKQRMSTADIAAEIGCLRSKLHGMRVTNVYDISSKVRTSAQSSDRGTLGAILSYAY
jgi:predicted ribosome quality control (RQC) complex YloA/Tae2 family protein